MTDVLARQFPDFERRQLVASRYDHQAVWEMSMSETATPTTTHESLPTGDYRSALKCAFVFQAHFVLLACLMLDGGAFRRAYCAVSIGFWIAAAGVLIFRPGEWGLRFLRYGVVVGFGLVVIAMMYWREWVLDVVGG